MQQSEPLLRQSGHVQPSRRDQSANGSSSVARKLRLGSPAPRSLDRKHSSKRQGVSRSDTHLGQISETVKTACMCDEFDRQKVAKVCTELLGYKIESWNAAQDWLYVPLSRSSQTLCSPNGLSTSVSVDALADDGLGACNGEKCLVFFQDGVVVMWGLAQDETEKVLTDIVPRIAIRPLPSKFIEEDELTVWYYEGIGDGINDIEDTDDIDFNVIIKDDSLRLQGRLRVDMDARLAISHAVSQSTKLGVFEEQGLDLVQSTKHLPKELAQTGHCALSEKDLAKLTGRLFVHRSDVDLLSSALDQPEFFWQKPDSVSDLYKKVAEYYEIEERITAVNSRLEVTQSLLDMLQERLDKAHGLRLEWIVIVLVAIEGLFGLLEVLASVGILPHWSLEEA